MSYRGTRWLSDDSFNVLLGRIPGFSSPAKLVRRPRGAAESDVIFIAGTVDAAHALAEFWPCQRVAGGVYDPAMVDASIATALQPQGHGYEVRQLDGSGNVLATAPLLLAGGGDGSSGKLGFSQFLRTEPGVRALVLTLSGGDALARIGVSGSVPQISADVPVSDATTNSLRWSWTASDADNDPLFFTVQSSPDDGTSWHTVQPATPQQSVVLDTRTLRGGASSRLRVVATDGFHTAIAESEPFALPDHPPVVTITGISEGAVVPYGDGRTLNAFAMDVEDGSLPPGGITWTLTGPETRTSAGETFSLSQLPPGAYTVVAAAADSAGGEGDGNVHFVVRSAVIPTVPTPVVDGVLDDPAWTQAVTMPLPVFAGTPGTARIMRSQGRIYLGLSDLPYRFPPITIPGFGTITAAPANVSIYVDVNAGGGAAPQPGDVALTINEEGLLVQSRGNGTTMVNDLPNAGVESVVVPGYGGWTAEISLPESLFGGADNGLNLMFQVTVPHPLAPPFVTAWPPAANSNIPDTWVAAQTGALPPLANQPPVASAGADRVIDPLESVSVVLDGSVSRDPEGQPLSWQWTQTGGETVTLSGETTSSPSFTAGPVTAPTSWSFQLIVNDGAADSAPSTVTITALPATSPVVAPARELTVNPDGSVDGRLQPDNSGAGSTGLWNVEKSFDLQLWEPLGFSSPDLLGRIAFSDPDGGSGRRCYYRAERASAEGTLMPGFALSGDGGVRWVSVPHDDAFNSFPLTVSAWIKTSSTVDDTAGIVSKYNDASFDGWSLFLRKGKLHGWYLNGANGIYAPPLGLDGGFVADGNWHHVALVVNTGGGDLYVDGESRAHLDWTGTPTAPATQEPVLIGRYDLYELGFDGEIDEVSIWSTDLSPLQMVDLIRRAAAGPEAGLTALWTCDDGAGTTLTDTASGAHHGTLTGDPEWVTSTAPIRR
jgi:hypothetical protein